MLSKFESQAKIKKNMEMELCFKKTQEYSLL